MLKNSSNETFIGNDQYEGFCIDLLERIAMICNFTYTIKLVDDGFYGAMINGRFNGLIAELINKVGLIKKIWK